jgi:hypothetical protein
MSQENVEIVLGGLQRFDERRRPDPDLWHEDGLLTAPDGWPEPGPFKGRAAIMRQFERLIADYSAVWTSVRRVVVETEDWIVVEFRWHTRGASRGSRAHGIWRAPSGSRTGALSRCTTAGAEKLPSKPPGSRSR